MAQAAELQLTRTDTVDGDARVRHFDELDECTQEYLTAAASGSAPSDVSPAGLNAGDVVVFTEYYRVQ